MSTENKPYIEAMRLLRRSNAAQPHDDSRFPRARSEARRRAVQEGREEQ